MKYSFCWIDSMVVTRAKLRARTCGRDLSPIYGQLVKNPATKPNRKLLKRPVWFRLRFCLKIALSDAGDWILLFTCFLLMLIKFLLMLVNGRLVLYKWIHFFYVTLSTISHWAKHMKKKKLFMQLIICMQNLCLYNL